MSKFASKDVIGVVVLLALFVFAILVLTGTGGGSAKVVGFEMAPDPSIYNDRSSGTRGFFEWCQRLGYKAIPWREDWSSLPADASVLVCTAPKWTSRKDIPGFPGSGGPLSDSSVGMLTPADARAVKQWLSAGHTLLLMASNLPENHLIDVADPDTDSGSDQPQTFSDILGLGTQSALSQTNQNRRDFPPAQPSPLTEGVSSIRLSGRAGGERFLRTVPDFAVLFGDLSEKPAHDEPVVIEFTVGKGRVIAIADSYFACNANLARAGNPVFLAQALRGAAQPGAVVLFDEFHHGDAAGGGGIWEALGRPLQLGVAQLALAFVLLVIALALRFGTPIPLNARSGHVSGEYVESLAGLYRSAGATLPALETTYRQFLRDLCARFALPPDVSLSRLAEVAARRGRLDHDSLRQLLSSCERHLDQRRVNESELLDLVRQMERFRRQLDLS